MEFPNVRAIFDYKNVEAYLAKQLPKANWNATIVNAALIAVFIGIWSMLYMLIAPVFLSLLPGIPAGSLAAVYGSPTSIALKTFLELVCSFIGFFLTGGILHFIAKALGGTGSLKELLYVMSMVNLIILPLVLLLNLFVVIPCVGCILGLCTSVLAIYLYYLYYRILKVVYKLDRNKAILALIGLIVVCVIITLIFLGIYILIFGIHSLIPNMPA
jgi:hypothetical protein